MARKEGADEAVKEPNPTIDGRRANVNLAYLGAKNRTATLPRMFNILNNNLIFFFCFLVSYSLLARMPTYQSTAPVYPYVVLCILCKCNEISDCAYRFDFFEKEAICLFSIVFFSFSFLFLSTRLLFLFYPPLSFELK